MNEQSAPEPGPEGTGRRPGIAVQRCLGCERHLFPERLVCPRCGGTDFGDATLEQGLIEQSTELADGTVLATISTAVTATEAATGPTLIARIIGRAGPGDAVALTTNPDDPGPAAFVPSMEAPPEP